MKENLRLMIVGATITGFPFLIWGISIGTPNIEWILALWSTGLVILTLVSTFDLASVGKEGDNIEDTQRGVVLFYGAAAPISGPMLLGLYAILYLMKNRPDKKIQKVIEYFTGAPK